MRQSQVEGLIFIALCFSVSFVSVNLQVNLVVDSKVSTADT